MPSVLLIPIVPVDPIVIGRLVQPLQNSLRADVRIDQHDHVDPSTSYDFTRRQYNSTLLIESLIERFYKREGKILGVTTLDLFVPVLTYVFGEAQLDGKVAVVSSFRLDETFYGLPGNRLLMEERLFKEALHELGHTFGLVHCHDYNCVMHSSTSVEEIDIKGKELCLSCRTQMSLPK